MDPVARCRTEPWERREDPRRHSRLPRRRGGRRPGCVRLPADRPEREGRPAGGERQRQGARHVPVEGQVHHVLAWGAVNAQPSESGRPQVELSLDYSGGWGSQHRPVWKTFADSCTPVDVKLAWLVTACQASDGSYWALQSWQRTLHIYGIPTVALTRRVGASPLALDGRDREARRPLRLDVSPVPADLRAADVQGPPRLRLQPQAGPASRSTTTGGTSTSTRSTPSTDAAGSARTAFSRTTRRAASATASTRTARIRRAAGRSTARR